jgi:uncharacterized tellurite resistance protein B-like protein
MFEFIRKRGWLWSFLDQYCRQYDAARIRAALPAECFDATRPAMVRGKIALRTLMRQSGLRYGLPLRVEGLVGVELPADEALFLSALAREFDLCSAAALVFGVQLDPIAQRADLLTFLAALLDRDRLARRLQEKPALRGSSAELERLARKLAGPLWRRGRALVADPMLGLPMHNGLVYSDARFLGRLAMDSYRRGFFSEGVARRLRRFAHRERVALAEALLLLARADQALSSAARRSILGQLEALGLPSDLAREARELLRRPRPPEAIAAQIRSTRTRTFILEQVVLGSLADGWRSPGERQFLKRLAQTLGIPEGELARIEADLAEFYAAAPDFVDRFRVQDSLADLRDRTLGSVSELVERNWLALVAEAQRGRELSHALSVLAKGGKLTDEQRRRLREQLLDLAKTIPGLALFAAPGGLLLVMALAKVLPESFLPTILVDVTRGPEDDLPRALPPRDAGRLPRDAAQP